MSYFKPPHFAFTIYVGGECVQLDRSNVEMGLRIRSARETRGMSQSQLAEFCGINDSYLGQIERGMKTPSLKMLRRIANELCTDIGAIVSPPTDERSRALHTLMDTLSGCPLIVINTATEQARELAALYRQLSCESSLDASEHPDAYSDTTDS